MGKQNGSSPVNGAHNVVLKDVPRHVAIIMDGNGRWAKRRFLPRVEGHRIGVKTVRTIVEESRRLGVRYLTLFAFSTENWRRPEQEVSSLMKIFVQHLEGEAETLRKNGIHLRVIGDRERLPKVVREAIERCESRTDGESQMELILAISYGGREEILHAARESMRRAMNGDCSPEQLDEASFRSCFYAPDIPDPDLLIRTSDECRISNFLLWQLAYAEIVVSPLLWPEFDLTEYHRCLREYGGRDRRFGLTQEQVGLHAREDR